MTFELRRLLVAAGVMLCACGLPVKAFTLRDDAERNVVFAQAPRRLVTLLPSLTEAVCALDACERLVATDRFSNWPDRVNGLPKAGGLDDAAVELIVTLRPDVVLLSRSQRITDRLRSLGVPTFVVSTETYADIDRVVLLLGQLLALPTQATLLTQHIDAEVAAVSERAQARSGGTHPSVYYEIDRAPYAAGPRSFIGEMLARLGTRNIVTPDLGPFPKLNPEYVVGHDPDVIFVAAVDAPLLAQRPGWNAIRAVREQRLCAFESAVNDAIVRPGPRVAQGMRALADCLERVAPRVAGPSTPRAPAPHMP